MRALDRKLLEKPYEQSESPGRFAKALGLETTCMAKLTSALTADLDTSVFGFGWWTVYEPQLGCRARIAISDHLVCSAESVESNLVEAALHLLELLEARDAEDTFVATMASVTRSGELQIKQPRRVRPVDELANRQISMHVAGFFRAVASAFDCMGACVAGVLGLERKLIEQTWGKAQRDADALPKEGPRGETWKALKLAIRKAGPAGWLKWTLDYRHMLVHRARRMEAVSATPTPTGLLTATGQIHVRTKSQALLVRYPSLSEIEAALVDANRPLTEEASTTLRGISRSANEALEAIAEILTEFWEWRKDDSAAIVQPASQWPELETKPVQFAGYAPSEVKLKTDLGIAAPQTIRRWQAASLTGDERANWPNFGGRGDNS